MKFAKEINALPFNHRAGAHLVKMIALNVDDMTISDGAFRVFIRNTLQIAFTDEVEEPSWLSTTADQLGK